MIGITMVGGNCKLAVLPRLGVQLPWTLAVLLPCRFDMLLLWKLAVLLR